MIQNDIDPIAKMMADVKQHAGRLIDLATQMEKLNAQQNEHITRAQTQLTNEEKDQLSGDIMLVYTLGDRVLKQMSAIQKNIRDCIRK